jgi:2-keto-4-pentenoate hydratase/2-oxohepta-3-ene-1,7-dioic acid hydratase in catechol pathway
MPLWVRFDHLGADKFGILQNTRIAVHAGNMFASPQPTGEMLSLSDVHLLAPLRPRLFIGLWNNFHALAAKTNAAIPSSPLYFLKSPGSIIPPGAAIRPPPSNTGRVLYEGELGIVIGQTSTCVTEAEAASRIFGYTCVNDVTALDILNADPAFPQWARAKSPDSFGPVGPAIATGLEWSSLTIRTLLNGRERQNYPAADMIFSPPRIVSLISQEFSLLPGDLIACGTSIGALPMRSGMTVEIVIDGIGTLSNRVEAHS